MPPRIRTYARCDMRAALLVAAGAPVAVQSRYAFLAGALARRVVAALAGRPDRMAVAGCGRERERVEKERQ